LVGSHLLWFTTTQKYPGEHVQDFGVLPNRYAQEYRKWSRKDMWWDKGDGLISLTVNSQRVQLGRWLDVDEAQEIVTLIQRSFPEYSNAKESA